MHVFIDTCKSQSMITNFKKAHVPQSLDVFYRLIIEIIISVSYTLIEKLQVACKIVRSVYILVKFYR